MFETIPFAVAMSPVVRVADPPGPRNDSAAKLAMVGVLTPGPVAMDLLTHIQIHRLDDVERTEYLVAWERAARWVEAQRMKAGAAVARGEISYSHARVLSTETFDLDDATAGQVAAAVLRRDEQRTPSQVPGRGPPGGDPSRPGAGRAGRRAGGPGTDGGQAGP